MKIIIHTSVVGLLLISLVLLNGCAMFRVRVKNDDVSNLPALNAKYGAQDLRKLSQDVADEIAKVRLSRTKRAIPGL